MNYDISYDKQPRKFLKKTDKHIAKRIVSKVDEVLAKDPVPHDAKTIVGERGVFRVRIGDYRILYRIRNNEKRIIIFKLDKRKRVY